MHLIGFLFRFASVFVSLLTFRVFREVSGARGDYVGCFQDQEENRLLSEVKEWSSNLTSTSCISTCSKRGYPFAGTQQSSECYCGLNRPPLIAKRPNSECYRTCSGDTRSKCGGDLRLSIYDTGIAAVGTLPKGFHLGCFMEKAEKEYSNLLPDLQQEFSNLTPKLCTEFCYTRGFKLSGVKNGRDCHCTNKKLDNSNHKRILYRGGCDTPCAGDKSKKCGGDQELNVYATGLTDTPATGRMVACYDDGPDAYGYRVRALANFRAELRKTLTPRICLNMCYQMGFSWAGVAAGYECYCGTRRPAEEKLLADTECNMLCEGSPGETCGGLWRLHVYRTPLADPEQERDTVAFMGCYQDQKGHRLLGEVKEWSAELIPSACIDLCSKGGYAFAGIHHSSDCFCGHNRPPSMAKRPDSECSAPCSGDPKQKCGGVNNGLSVYKTGVSGIGALPSEFYLGCFSEAVKAQQQRGRVETRNPRLLPDLEQDLESSTPKLCSEFCFKKGYKLAGLQREKCFCSNQKLDLTKKVSENECTVVCEGDGSKKCGGGTYRNFLSVYATGLTENPTTGRLLSCFEDEPTKSSTLSRPLPDFRTDLRGTNSPRTCMNLCHQMGFKFSGVQIGYKCFCGKSQPAKEKVRPNSECNTQCSGDSNEKCGGNWRLQVYKTPLADGADSTVTTSTTRRTTTTNKGSTTTTRRTSPVTQRPTTTPSSTNCQLSTTIVNGKRACKNAVVLFDDFRQFDPKRWSHEIKIANKPSTNGSNSVERNQPASAVAKFPPTFYLPTDKPLDGFA